LRVWGLVFRVQGFELWLWSLGFTAHPAPGQ